jgi:hypothetical protein
MSPPPRKLIWVFILLAPVVSPQSVGLRTNAQCNPPLPAPPPPPIRKEALARPTLIRVGSSVQSDYWGPEARWTSGKRLSDAEITACEQSLEVNPQDMCTRAQLIASTYPTSNSQTVSRIDQLLWMIQHHPEWEGFILGPSLGLAEPRSDAERASYGRLKQAWLDQAGPQQERGIVLHNAAMFFAIREPAFAAALLQRAIEAEPDNPLYVERLGTVYADAFFPEPMLGRFDTVDTPERETFRQQAQAALLSSNDWVLVAGAFAEMQSKANWAPADLNRRIRLRVEALTGGGDGRWKLPSHSAQYRRGSECDALFPERK